MTCSVHQNFWSRTHKSTQYAPSELYGAHIDELVVMRGFEEGGTHLMFGVTKLGFCALMKCVDFMSYFVRKKERTSQRWYLRRATQKGLNSMSFQKRGSALVRVRVWANECNRVSAWLQWSTWAKQPVQCGARKWAKKDVMLFDSVTLHYMFLGKWHNLNYSLIGRPRQLITN